SAARVEPAAAPAGEALVAGAAGSTWSCAGATGPRGQAPGALTLSNLGARPARAEVELVSDQGWSRHVPVTVSPGAELVVQENAPGTTSWAGAVVTVYGSGVAVTQRINTRWGTSLQPCAPSASTTWYFASGSVLSGTSEEITLVNPYASVADVKLSFVTDEGVEAPAAFSSISVPPRGMASVNLASHLRRRQFVAATVEALSGEVVAFRTEVVRPGPPGAGVAGATLQLGSPSPSRLAWFAQGGQGPGQTETFWAYNPGTRPARVHMSFSGDVGGGAAGQAGYTSVEVAAHGVARIVTNGQSWVLPGSRYSVTVRSDVPVVVERDLLAEPESGVRGRASLAGSGVAAPLWVLPALAGWALPAPARVERARVAQPSLIAGSPFGRLFQSARQVLQPPDSLLGQHQGAPGATVFVDVFNPGLRSADLTLAGARGALGPGQAERIPLSAAYWGRPVLVRSTAPVVVSVFAYSASQLPGADLSPAVPVVQPR
ncbi:MAG TPA: DUF5719 family protein, partial [Acidimicrobiales bacterium]|nr:DUF5719 family protein [Acidimicrobiales bacterium]